MTEIKLSKPEATILTEAAGQNGRVTLPETTKPSTRERILGRLLRDGLIVSGEEGAHGLTPAGYRAVGLEPPPTASGSKKALVQDLLRRKDGATLAELVAATGWLPHTTRAALSRLRGGETEELTKGERADGARSYRLQPRTPEPAPKRTRAGRAKAAEATGAAA